MDDYLTKPVQLAALRSVLDRWLRSVPTSKQLLVPANVSPASMPPAEAPPAAVPATKDMQPGERALLHLSTRRTPRMRELFATESQQDVNFIIEAEVAGETELLRQRAHRLKGASYAFGAELLGDLAAEIERQIKSGQTDVADLVANLDPLFGRTILELERITQAGSNP